MRLALLLSLSLLPMGGLRACGPAWRAGAQAAPAPAALSVPPTAGLRAAGPARS